MLLLLLILIIILILITILIVSTGIEETFQVDTSNGYTTACNEINSKRLFLRNYIQTLRVPVQDLSSNIYSAYYGKNENMKYQTQFTDKCLANGINQPCKKLATVDAHVFKVLPEMTLFYRTLLMGEYDIDSLLQQLNKYAELIDCPNISSIRATGDTSGNEVFNNTRDLGKLNIYELSYELEKLSPYYLSPDVVEYLLKFLISQEQLDSLNFTSADYVKQQINIMSKVGCLYGNNPSSC